jgi:hypothetical protein
MESNCTVCDRLWTAYQDAVKVHLQVLGEYQMAVIEEDATILTNLDPLLRAAEERRHDARQAVKNHEATHGKS